MGFGLLLIGYFLANILPVISFFSVAMIPGFAMITVGLYRLAPYHKRFYFSWLFSLPSSLFGLYYTLYSLVSIGIFPRLEALGGTVFNVVEWIYLVYTLTLSLLILWSIASLSSELGLYGIQSAAWRNLTFVAIYHTLFFIVKLPLAVITAHATAFVLPITILRYLCVFLNLWLFFRCLRDILPEGSDIEVSNSSKEKKND
ncbi:MAG: hypothetical protein IKA06_06095 [Clostridia bacterium]|nr:hypothetical protein [Clostridia bacterium]